MTEPSTDQTSVERDVVFRIRHAELDTAQRQLRFSGTPVDVQPKVFDLIEYLIRARDRVVGKDELFDNIWPAVVVTEASLTQSIKRARDLFRQNGFDDDVIRTVARKGYQFDGDVEVVATAPHSQDGARKATRRPAAAIAIAIVAILAVSLGWIVRNPGPEDTPWTRASDAAHSLVVLPFENQTPDEDFRYFSDGLTDTVTSSLTTVRELRVIARGSAYSFRSAVPDYAEIGRELGVGWVVEGSVQRSEDVLRISAQLIGAQDGQQIWSQIYSRSLDDTFAIQDEIARSIVDQMSSLLALRLELPISYTGDTGGADDAEAYRLLLLGQSKRRRASAGELAEAEGHFREALELRPDYPEAMLSLADAIRVRAVLGELPREPSFAEAMTLIRDALAARPQYGDAYLQLAEIQHRHFWDFERAAESYGRALELNPGSALVHTAYSRFLSKVGEFEASVREARIAEDLNPRSSQAASSLAIRLIRDRQLDAGREVIDRFRATYPDHADLPWLETNWHIRNGSYRDALSFVTLEELDYLRLSLSAIALFHLDRAGQAEAALDELIRTDADGAAFQIAEVYAQWGDPDRAFEWLERAFSHGDPGMAELYSSVNLENLYPDPRFADLATRVGLPPLVIR